MIDFDYYVNAKKVFPRKPDKNLALSLIEDAKNRIKFAEKNLGTDPKYAFENAYESVRELLDALLAIRGYKTYSHEAAIAFLMKFEFKQPEMENMDRLRQKRNDCKYYGARISYEDAKKEMEDLELLFNKILALLKRERVY